MTSRMQGRQSLCVECVRTVVDLPITRINGFPLFQVGSRGSAPRMRCVVMTVLKVRYWGAIAERSFAVLQPSTSGAWSLGPAFQGVLLCVEMGDFCVLLWDPPRKDRNRLLLSLNVNVDAHGTVCDMLISWVSLECASCILVVFYHQAQCCPRAESPRARLNGNTSTAAGTSLSR